jgi:hypothetical protein
MILQFSDKAVNYATFVQDVATAVVALMHEPEYVSQNEAFRRFGRRNVERWRNQNKIEPCIRPGKIEYNLADLRKLKAAKQDYF